MQQKNCAFVMEKQIRWKKMKKGAKEQKKKLRKKNKKEDKRLKEEES
jgi:hypothetical protein